MQMSVLGTGFGSTPSRLGWYDQQDLVAWWLWRPCQCCQLPNWSPVINEDSRYGYLMIFEYWQISYMIICCTKAPVSAKTCEAWFIMCIYIYIHILCIHVCLLTYYFLLWKDEEGTKPETSGVTPWPAQELEAVYIEAVWYYYCALMEPKAIFLPSKNNMDHTIYIYIQGLDFDVFWCILMGWQILDSWQHEILHVLLTSAAQVIPRRSAQRARCHEIPEVQNKQKNNG